MRTLETIQTMIASIHAYGDFNERVPLIDCLNGMEYYYQLFVGRKTGEEVFLKIEQNSKLDNVVIYLSSTNYTNKHKLFNNPDEISKESLFEFAKSFLLVRSEL